MTDFEYPAPAEPRRGSRWADSRHRHRVGRSRLRWRLVAGVFAGVLALVCGLVAATVFAAASKYDRQVKRIDAFPAVPHSTESPRTRIDGPLNILVLGSDRRVGEAGLGQRTDTIMMIHLQADQKHGYVISIPRDAYVHLPPGPGLNGGKNKINAAYSYGGVKMLVQTIEEFTGDKIDHVVIVDFNGLARMVDALGGVDVMIDKAVTDSETHFKFPKGLNHLRGGPALYYVRERHGLPEGDFDRIKRQHQFLSALLGKAASTGTLTNPLKLNAFLDAASKSISVDKGLPLVDFAFQMRGLRPADFTFVTIPTAGYDNIEGVGSVVVPDEVRDAELFTAISSDTLQSWAAANPKSVSNTSHGL